jgi:hypothetical protein
VSTWIDRNVATVDRATAVTPFSVARGLSERTVTWLSAGLIAAIVLSIWIPWMFSPLTLDETGIYWVISGGPAHIVPRAIFFPQSILYCFLLWGEATLGGSSEFVLRLPSLIASVTTLLLLCRLGARAIGQQNRFLLPLLWLFFVNPPSLAVQARPYALAMCAGAWALYAMDGFLSQGRTRQLWTYALAATISTYFSLLFALFLAGCAAFLVLLTFWYRRVRARQCLAIMTFWAAMLLPLVPQFRAGAASSALHSVAIAARGREDLCLAFLPLAVVLGLMAALVTTLIRGEPVQGTRWKPELLVLAVVVAVTTIVPLYAVTQFTPAKLWTSRYISLAFAPLALLYTAILGRFSGASGRLAAIVAPAVLLFAPSVSTRMTPAAEIAGSFPKIVAALDTASRNTNGHLYLLSQFPEGWRWRFPVADADKEWLLAQFRYYKLSEPYDIIPYALEQGDPAWRGTLIGKIRAESDFVVGGTWLPAWLETATTDTHSLRFLTRTDSYFIAVFTRRR